MTREMANLIMMAKEYQKRPSEIMGISNDYAAYCFDEVALLLRYQATDDKGNVKWNRIKWRNEKTKTNKDLMNFIEKYS
jgi:hypothetical protein